MGCGCTEGGFGGEVRPIERKSTQHLFELKSAKLKTQKSKTLEKSEWYFNAHNFLFQKTATVIYKEYDIDTSPIGGGAFGKVYKAKHKPTGEMRAIKVIKKRSCTNMELQNMLQEVQVIKILDHPNIVNINEFYEGKKQFFIIMDYCQGGELFGRIKQLEGTKKGFSEKETTDIIRQILRALVYCHSQGVVHRDIKPENIMMQFENKNTIKIIDWGTSRQFDKDRLMKNKIGTPYYMAPEVVKRQYDEKCDVWSVGVIAYILLCGQPPFNGGDNEEIMSNICKGNFDFTSDGWKGRSQESKDFITYLLTYDALTRPTAKQAIEHQWLDQEHDHSKCCIQQDALQRMKSFHTKYKLQKAIWVYLVSLMATQKEKEQLRVVFNQLDRAKNGVLSKEEVLNGWNHVFDTDISDEEIEEIFKNIDVNENGTIEYSEFIMGTINRQKMINDDRLEKVFKLCDVDHDGTITASDLKAIFKGQSEDQEISNKMWEQLLEEGDYDEDGDIELQEFLTLMKKMQ